MTSDEWLKQRAWDAGQLIVQGIHEISLKSADAKGGRYKSAFRSDIALAQHHIAAAMQEAEQRLLERLRNPDEAMVEAFMNASDEYYNADHDVSLDGWFTHICRAIAATLDEKEKADG